MIRYIGLGIILLLIAILLYRSLAGVNREYKKQVEQSLDNKVKSHQIITEEDLADLPEPLVRYLNYGGVVGTEHVSHYKIQYVGRMKLEQDSKWEDIEAEQYSFINEGRRLFSIAMDYKGIKINGLHHFYEDDAYMKIRILDLIQVVHKHGENMKKAETVTWYNDMCLWAPGALLQADIEWKTIDKNHVIGILTHDEITVEATLEIDDDGKLINFISEDRYFSDIENQPDETVKWSTPIYRYSQYHGMNLASEGEAIWHYEAGDFSYIELTVKDVMINP